MEAQSAGAAAEVTAIEAELEAAGGAPMQARRDTVSVAKQVRAVSMRVHTHRNLCCNRQSARICECCCRLGTQSVLHSVSIGSPYQATTGRYQACLAVSMAYAQDLAEASTELARQKATVAAATKTDKSLAADCVKREGEHAKLEEDLKALLERVAAADGTAEALRADVEATEAEATAATTAFDSLFEQVCSAAVSAVPAIGIVWSIARLICKEQASCSVELGTALPAHNTYLAHGCNSADAACLSLILQIRSSPRWPT